MTIIRVYCHGRMCPAEYHGPAYARCSCCDRLIKAVPPA